MNLPRIYDNLTPLERRAVRSEYERLQNGLCMHCQSPLSEQPPSRITDKKIDRSLFPKNFFNYPVHLQHCHKTGLTEGAVHVYCNAVLWQYSHR
jgi:hypothetical protein